APLLFINCQNKEGYELTGQAIGYEDGTKILVQTFSFKDNFPVTKDTLIVKDGKFSETYSKSSKPVMNILRVEDEQFSVIYFPENVDLTATLNKEDPRE